MIDRFFNDPRHRESEELAFRAERHERSGNIGEALGEYAQAAALEEQVALAVPIDVPRLRTLLGISAVALWVRAENWDEAARAGCTLLSQPSALTEDGAAEIRALVDRAWRSEEMAEVVGTDGAYVPLEVRLSGGLVRAGLAPTALLSERREVVPAMVLRVAEWRSSRPFRKAGRSALAASYDILEAPALAASYAFRFFVGTRGQQLLDGLPATPQDVVEHFLLLAEAAASGPDAVGRLVVGEEYLRTFLRGFRDLAPDGELVGQIHLSSPSRGRPFVSPALTRETRERLTREFVHTPSASPLEDTGVLKMVNLRGDDPKIGIDTAAGLHRFRIVKGEHDDTIGPKVNRRVRVVGRRETASSGETDDWADDVIVLEQPEP